MGDGASPEVFTLIPEPKDISGPEITPEFADFTHQQSDSGFRERKPTFKSSGNVTFNCNFIHDNATQQAMITAALANPPTLKNFQMIFPDGYQIDFSGYLGLRFSNPMAGPEEIAVTITLEGAFVPVE